ncbi:MAG: 16S rRNA (cytosine(1402)-N(4))-methyltransferase RsmH [Pseudomonadota bacterium]
MTHIPVLKNEIIAYLDPKDGGVYVDCTAGRGGHIQALLDSGKDILVIGIDKDSVNAAFLEKEFLGKNVKVACSDYSSLDDVIGFYDIKKADGFIFDLGFSSIHVDDAKRGFSFSKNGPLDMRYNTKQDLTAEHVVNEYEGSKLIDIIKEYGEESFCKNIVSAILRNRSLKRITTTTELRDIIHSAIPAKFKREKSIDPATKTFQAIRIEVNSELESLEEGLKKAVNALKPGGRVCVISFHSIEDRIVKRMFNGLVDPCTCPIGLAQCLCGQKPVIKLTVKTPITASKNEINLNPRARSAKLRVAEKL